jgi:hypothetical protein
MGMGRGVGMGTGMSRRVPMNPFISDIVRNTILGMLSPLKGFKKGKIEIRF